MKALILAILLSFGVNDTEGKVTDNSWVLDEMNAAITMGSNFQLEENKIKLVDLQGNMIAEYNQELVIQNELPLTELKEIMESEFLFESQGDSYYLALQ